MKLKTLRPLAAALVIASLAPSAIAETLAEEHPAVRVAQTWSTRGIDPNAFIVAHPAGPQLLAAASPTEKDKSAIEAIGDSSRPPSAPADAQAQAARLLSHPHTAGAWKPTGQVRAPSRVSAAMDAQASAAALLSRSLTVGSANAVLPIDQQQLSDRHMAGDAQAQAAALLSGSRISANSPLRAQRTHGGARTSAQNR